MASLFPFALSNLLDLAGPTPASPDTIHVTTSYTVDAGDALDIAGSPGFKLEVKNGSNVTLQIDGTVNVDGGSGPHAYGVTTSRSVLGDAAITIGVTGSLTVVGDETAAGVVLAVAGGSFANDGALHVTAAGDAYGAAGQGPDNALLVNNGQLMVEAGGAAYGFNGFSDGAELVNNAEMTVTAGQAVGMANLIGTATITNNGSLLVVADQAGGFAVGAALYHGAFTNNGDIHVFSDGYAFGAEIYALSDFTNNGQLIAVARGADPAIGLLFASDTGGGLIVNNGAIRGDTAVMSGDAFSESAPTNDVIINNGTLAGDVMLGGGSDGISDNGRIEGDIDLGDGGDILISNRGRIEGAIIGGLGDDYIEASKAGDTIWGDAQDDTLGGGDDELRGMKGDDNIFGGQGDDTLIGGKGIDFLTGGSGDDVFKFMKLGDSSPLSADFISDLTATDVIDLSHIDADTGAGGDQAFHVVGAFSSAAGELTITYNSGSDQTLFQGDVDGDGSADLFIAAAGDHSSFTNFVL